MKKITLSPQFLLKCWLLSMACRAVESLSAFDTFPEEQLPRSIEDNWSAAEFEQNLNSYSYQPEFYNTSNDWQMNEGYAPSHSSYHDQPSYYSSQSSAFPSSYTNGGSEGMQERSYYQENSSPYSYRDTAPYSSEDIPSKEEYYSDWTQEHPYSRQGNFPYYSEPDFSQASAPPSQQDSSFISWQDVSSHQEPFSPAQEGPASSYLNGSNDSLQTTPYDHEGRSSYPSQMNKQSGSPYSNESLSFPSHENYQSDWASDPSASHPDQDRSYPSLDNSDRQTDAFHSTPDPSLENQHSFYSSQEDARSYDEPSPHQVETSFPQNNENAPSRAAPIKKASLDDGSSPAPADKASEQNQPMGIQSPSSPLNNYSSSSDLSSQGQSYPFEEKRFDWNTNEANSSIEQQKKWINPVPVTTDFTHPSVPDEVKASEAKPVDAEPAAQSKEKARTTPSSELKNDQKSVESPKTEEKGLNLNQGKGNIKIIRKSPASSTDKAFSQSNDNALNVVGKKTITAPEVGLVDPLPSPQSQSIIAETIVDNSSLKQAPSPVKTVSDPKQSSGSTVASKALDKQSLALAIEKEEEQKTDSIVAQTLPREAPRVPPVLIPAPIPAPPSAPAPASAPTSAHPVHPARAAAARPTIVTPADPDPNPVPAASPQGPTINFNNVAMIEYIRFISRISNRNFIFDEEDLQFNVTIISEEPTSIDNLMAALLQELRIRDLLIIEQGNNIIIHRNPRIRAPARIVVDGTEPSSPRDSELVTRVFRLNTLDPMKASEIIKPLLSDDALVEVLRDSNNLIITDIAANVNKIAQLIASLDAPNSGVTVGQYVVRNAFVASLVDLAAKILQPIAQGNPFVLVPHSATNSIYIVSNPFIVEKALAILENLDINEGRTKILSLEKLRLQEGAPGGAMAPGTLGAGAGGVGGPGAGGPGGPGGPGAGGVPGAPGGPGLVGIPNVPGGAGGINVPGTPNYNPALPSSYPLGGAATPVPGGLNIPGSPTYNPNLPPSLPLGPGGIGVEGRQGPPSAMFEEGREFIPGGISVAPRWNQELPAGHIERTLFFLYKLKYRRGDQIEIALRRIADSLAASGTTNADLVAAILSSQWLEASNSLIFTGTVSALERIKELILEIDTPLRQVFIEMLILDTSIQDSLTYSVDWGQRFGGGNTAGGEAFVSGNTTLAANLDAGTNAGTAATATTTAQAFTGPTSNGLFGVQGFTLGVIGRHLTHNGLHFNTIGALVHALHTDTKVNIIMNPKIVTEDNNTAEVFVGSTDRYKTQSIANDLGTVITNNFQFIDVGTTLRVTPLIGNNDIITLDIIEEVTNDSGAANATSANTAATDVNLVPVLSKTRTTTRIHVPNGFFVILSGMISGTESRTMNQIPCLGGIPLIGVISKQKGNADSKRNLMIFIRPLIVDTEEELENITKRQQDVFQEKCKFRRSWNYEIDEALDFMSIRPTDPDEIGCRIK